MFKARTNLAIIILLGLTLTSIFNACIYQVEVSQIKKDVDPYGNVYLEQNESVDNVLLWGYYPIAGVQVDLYCNDNQDNPILLDQINITEGNALMSFTLEGKSDLILSSCKRTNPNKVTLFGKLGSKYIPIMSNDNMYCISTKTNTGMSLTDANISCLESDPRENSSLDGFNTTVMEVNELKVHLFEENATMPTANADPVAWPDSSPNFRLKPGINFPLVVKSGEWITTKLEVEHITLPGAIKKQHITFLNSLHNMTLYDDNTLKFKMYGSGGVRELRFRIETGWNGAYTEPEEYALLVYYYSDNNVAETVIGPAGGKISVSGTNTDLDGLEIEFPAGALSEIKTVRVNSVYSTFSAGGDHHTVLPRFTIDVGGEEYSGPATISGYLPEGSPALIAGGLFVKAWDVSNSGDGYSYSKTYAEQVRLRNKLKGRIIKFAWDGAKIKFLYNIADLTFGKNQIIEFDYFRFLSFANSSLNYEMIWILNEAEYSNDQYMSELRTKWIPELIYSLNYNLEVHNSFCASIPEKILYVVDNLVYGNDDGFAVAGVQYENIVVLDKFRIENIFQEIINLPQKEMRASQSYGRLNNTVAHENAHLYQEYYLNPYFKRRWMEEGMATFYADWIWPYLNNSKPFGVMNSFWTTSLTLDGINDRIDWRGWDTISMEYARVIYYMRLAANQQSNNACNVLEKARVDFPQGKIFDHLAMADGGDIGEALLQTISAFNVTGDPNEVKYMDIIPTNNIIYEYNLPEDYWKMRNGDVHKFLYGSKTIKVNLNYPVDGDYEVFGHAGKFNEDSDFWTGIVHEDAPGFPVAGRISKYERAKVQNGKSYFVTVVNTNIPDNPGDFSDENIQKPFRLYLYVGKLLFAHDRPANSNDWRTDSTASVVRQDDYTHRFFATVDRYDVWTATVEDIAVNKQLLFITEVGSTTSSIARWDVNDFWEIDGLDDLPLIYTNTLNWSHQEIYCRNCTPATERDLKYQILIDPGSWIDLKQFRLYQVEF